MCFLCITDRGTVQKVIVLPKDDLETEELMLEEVEVFKVRPCMALPTASESTCLCEKHLGLRVGAVAKSWEVPG